jgi:hypothetical protein
MATTTNYGWTTPDDTALVKDGAAAIRTLGTSIDTTTKNLNPSTTLGDIEYRSSTANVNTRLGIGTALQVLRVNSGANAPEWATLSTGAATLIDTVNLTSGNSQTSASLSGAYDNLIIYMEDFYASGGGANVGLRFNSDTGSNYTSAGVRSSSGGSPGVVGNAAADRAYFIDQMENAQTNNFAVIYIPNYDSGTIKGFSGTAQFKDTQYFTKTFQGVWNAVSTITTIQFVTSGTWVAGTAKIYGVNK